MTAVFTYRDFFLNDTPRLDGRVALVTVYLSFLPIVAYLSGGVYS